MRSCPPAAQLEFVLKAAVKRGDALKAVLVGYVLKRVSWTEALAMGKVLLNKQMWFRGQMLLAAWHSGSWVLKRPVWAAVSTEVDYWAEKIMRDKYVEKIWNDVCGSVAALPAKWGFRRMTLSLELCPRTLREHKTCRLHVHGGFEADKEVTIKSAMDFALSGAPPDRSRGSAPMERMAGAGLVGGRENLRPRSITTSRVRRSGSCSTVAPWSLTLTTG